MVVYSVFSSPISENFSEALAPRVSFLLQNHAFNIELGEGGGGLFFKGK